MKHTDACRGANAGSGCGCICGANRKPNKAEWLSVLLFVIMCILLALAI